MSEDQYWAAARELLQRACTHAPLGSAIYNEVTENRQRRGYSSCGDLAHWMLHRLGVRFPWINREEMAGTVYGGKEHPGWRIGENVMHLTRYPIGANRIAVKPTRDSVFLPGDIIVVNTLTPATTHVSVVFSYDHASRAMLTGDYGQPHGKFVNKPITLRDGKLWRGARSIDSWLRLADVIIAAEAANALEDLPNELIEDAPADTPRSDGNEGGDHGAAPALL